MAELANNGTLRTGDKVASKEGYPKFDEIDWHFNEDTTAGVAAVESGAADVYSPVAAKDVPRLKTLPNVTIYEAPLAGSPVTGFGFDKSIPPFNDKRVRQAVSLIVEPEERTEVCWFGTGDSNWGDYIYEIQGDWYCGIEPRKAPREERLATAAALLDEAGWVLGPDGKRVAQGVEGVEDGTPFEIDVPYEANWPASECHTQLLQKWGADVGLTFNPIRYDPGAFWSDVCDGKMQMWHAGIGGGLLPDEAFRVLFHSKGEYNKYWIRWSTPEVDAMIEAARAEPDMEKKKELVCELDRYLADEVWGIAVGSQNTLVLTTADLVGFYPRMDDSSRALVVSDIPGR